MMISYELYPIIDRAKSNITKLNNKALELEGMSSRNIKNLLNICVSGNNVRYLEIGVCTGSTFYSALYGNKPEIALAIDNFSQFGGRNNKQKFINNMSDNGVDYQLIDADCFSIDLKSINHQFNVYFYDANHSFNSHILATEHFVNILADEFLYICDDYNNPGVRKATHEGIINSKLHIIEQVEIIDNSGAWWNGLYLAKLKKLN